MQDSKMLEKQLEEIDFKKVGLRIKEVRKLKEMTQAELATICGCTSNHLSAVENGTNKPSIELVMRISIALNQSVDYFLMDAPHAYPKYKIDSQISEKLDRCDLKMLKLVDELLDSLLDYQDAVSEN